MRLRRIFPASLERSMRPRRLSAAAAERALSAKGGVPEARFRNRRGMGAILIIFLSIFIPTSLRSFLSFGVGRGVGWGRR
jgi:hypothetical protein